LLKLLGCIPRVLHFPSFARLWAMRSGWRSGSGRSYGGPRTIDVNQYDQPWAASTPSAKLAATVAVSATATSRKRRRMAGNSSGSANRRRGHRRHDTNQNSTRDAAISMLLVATRVIHHAEGAGSAVAPSHTSPA